MSLLLPPACNWFCSKVIDVNQDGSVCAYAAKNEICVVHLADTQNCVTRLSALLVGHTDRVTSLAFTRSSSSSSPSSSSSHSMLASAAADGSVRVWNGQDIMLQPPGNGTLTSTAQHSQHAKVSLLSFFLLKFMVIDRLID